jgi:hypothetical protein
MILGIKLLEGILMQIFFEIYLELEFLKKRLKFFKNKKYR